MPEHTNLAEPDLTFVHRRLVFPRAIEPSGENDYRKTRSRWRAARDRLRTAEAIAYHEAGHVVVACEFGWWVWRGGVRLGAWAHARFRRHSNSDNTMRARVCVYMAGLLAEQKYHGLKWRLEEDIIREIRAVRAGQDEGVRLDPSDLRADRAGVAR